MLFARFFRDHKGGVAPSSRLAGTVNWNNAKLRVALARRHRINVVERKMTALKTASRLVVDRRAPAAHRQQHRHYALHRAGQYQRRSDLHPC
jgi:hypothetical protein